MPTLTWRPASGDRAVYCITKAITTIGADRGCDVVIPGMGLEGHHARVIFDGRDFSVTEGEGPGKVQVNGRRRRKARLSHEDRLTIGDAELTFRVFDAPLGREEPSSNRRAELEGLRRLLVFGGELSDGSATDDLWAYDLIEGAWTQLTPEDQLPALSGFAVVQADRKVYVVGGTGDGGVPSTAVHRFDPVALTLETVGDLADGPGARTRIAATFDDAGQGKILVFGGYDADEVGHADAWELDLGEGTWSLRNAECTGRHCPSASEYPVLLARPASGGQSAEVAVFPSDDQNDVLHYKARPGEPWRNDLNPDVSPCEEGEAWQPGTRLCWDRCPVGQTWNGWECEGDVESADWYEAEAACDGEHSLPTKAELEDLLGGCEDYWLFELCEPCSTETTCGDILDEESTDCLLGKQRYWTSTGQGSWQWWAWAWWGNLADGVIGPARKHRELGMNARCMRELWELEL